MPEIRAFNIFKAALSTTQTDQLAGLLSAVRAVT
jgi:hypothetical protein